MIFPLHPPSLGHELDGQSVPFSNFEQRGQLISPICNSLVTILILSQRKMFSQQTSSSSASSTASTSASSSASFYQKPLEANNFRQPDGPILQFVWIVGAAKGNNIYECKLCQARFQGQRAIVCTHFEKSFSSQRVRECTSIQPQLLRDQIKTSSEMKKKELLKSEKKRAYSNMTRPDIGSAIASLGRPSADSAILQFIVTCGVAPLIVEHPAFRNLIASLRDAGPSYKPPKRHEFGVNSSGAASLLPENPNNLGRVLHAELIRVRHAKGLLLSGLLFIGGTLCNDGAKWRKRNLINSVLMTSLGSYFAQSTDATGHFKDAKYLLEDIRGAIANVGEENVFIVALDGACKSTMKMIWDDPSMHKIFPQRCSTHGCNLLLSDIGKLFLWEVNICIRLVKFILNHDAIFACFKKMPDTLMLLGTCDTRFRSTIYCLDRIKEDESALREFWSSKALREQLQRASNELKAEHKRLEVEFIYCQETWDRIGVFLDIEVPIRVVLRTSDSHKPNLAQMAPMFDQAQTKSLKAARKAETKFPQHYDSMEEKIDALFLRRKVDIVTRLCLAASMILPVHIFTDDGKVYTPAGGKLAINEVILRYYPSTSDQLKALLVLENLRSRTDIFGSERMMLSAKTLPPDDFFKVACAVSDDLVGLELFRKLANGYSGQGESERMNKQVKKFRTTTRNKQTHAVTSAYMELDTTYKLIESRQREPLQAQFLDLLKDAFEDVGDEVEAERIALDEAVAESEERYDFEEDSEREAPDVFRNALIEQLKNAPVTVPDSIISDSNSDNEN